MKKSESKIEELLNGTLGLVNVVGYTKNGNPKYKAYLFEHSSRRITEFSVKGDAGVELTQKLTKAVGQNVAVTPVWSSQRECLLLKSIEQEHDDLF